MAEPMLARRGEVSDPRIVLAEDGLVLTVYEAIRLTEAGNSASAPARGRRGACRAACSLSALAANRLRAMAQRQAVGAEGERREYRRPRAAWLMVEPALKQWMLARPGPRPACARSARSPDRDRGSAPPRDGATPPCGETRSAHSAILSWRCASSGRRAKSTEKPVARMTASKP